MSKKQTAVEWLFLMINNPNDNQEMAKKCFAKAKEMEKEQMQDAYAYGMSESSQWDNINKMFEQYYNETFNQ